MFWVKGTLDRVPPVNELICIKVFYLSLVAVPSLEHCWVVAEAAVVAEVSKKSIKKAVS